MPASSRSCSWQLDARIKAVRRGVLLVQALPLLAYRRIALVIDWDRRIALVIDRDRRIALVIDREPSKVIHGCLLCPDLFPKKNM